MRAKLILRLYNSRMYGEDLASKINLSPAPMALAAICSYALVLLFFIHTLLLFPLFVRVKCLVLALFIYFASFWFCNYPAEKEKVGCFTFVVF